MTEKQQQRVFGISESELNDILSAEYATVAPERDNCPDFLDSITDCESELVEGVDCEHEETILPFYPVPVASFRDEYPGGEAA